MGDRAGGADNGSRAAVGKNSIQIGLPLLATYGMLDLGVTGFDGAKKAIVMALGSKRRGIGLIRQQLLPEGRFGHGFNSRHFHQNHSRSIDRLYKRLVVCPPDHEMVSPFPRRLAAYE